MSIRKAVTAFCKGCIYDPSNGGTWMQQIRDCTVVKCELYDYRPGSKKVGPKRERTPAQVLAGQKLAMFRPARSSTLKTDVSVDS